METIEQKRHNEIKAESNAMKIIIFAESEIRFVAAVVTIVIDISATDHEGISSPTDTHISISLINKSIRRTEI